MSATLSLSLSLSTACNTQDILQKHHQGPERRYDASNSDMLSGSESYSPNAKRAHGSNRLTRRHNLMPLCTKADLVNCLSRLIFKWIIRKRINSGWRLRKVSMRNIFLVTEGKILPHCFIFSQSSSEQRKAHTQPQTGLLLGSNQSTWEPHWGFLINPYVKEDFKLHSLPSSLIASCRNLQYSIVCRKA